MVQGQTFFHLWVSCCWWWWWFVVLLPSSCSIRNVLAFNVSPPPPSLWSRPALSVQTQTPMVVAASFSSSTFPTAKRLLWNGPCFARLPKSGRKYLMERGGWEFVDYCKAAEDNNNDLLEFVWPNKEKPKKKTHGGLHQRPSPLALIRPYPTFVTNVLDDKLLLSTSLAGTGLMPKLVHNPHNDLVDNNNNNNKNQLFFVKHRHGAQGKSVYVYTYRQLLEWWSRTTSSNSRSNFIIQHEVPPALDPDGRKFVLRCHVLLHQETNHNHNSSTESCPCRWVHRDVICLPHGARYDPTSTTTERAIHISNQGGKRNRPKPVLVQHLPPNHPAYNCLPKVQAVCASMMDTIQLPPIHKVNDDDHTTRTYFALLGVDCLVSNNNHEIQICEVNSHPALGWGTMANVANEVFARLVTDTLAIVVFGDKAESTGYQWV